LIKIIEIKNPDQAVTMLKRIGVDSYGIGAMVPKTINVNILLEKQSCKIANIIKQEMLSLGGDAAVARGSVACSVPTTDVLIMGTIKQVSSLATKIEKQPFGLNIIARHIRETLDNIVRKEFVLKTSRREIVLGRDTKIMGILNVTPDSFSDGGFFYSPGKAIEHGLQMAEEGADIIDVGGESTRPGSRSVPVDVELKRVIPVIKGLIKKVKIPVSIDTKKARVAGQSVDAGAEIINDISALNGDKDMADTIKKKRAALVLMHMKGRPSNMQKRNLEYDNLMGEITNYLKESTEKAMKAGIGKESIIIDPGIGFGKTAQDNYKIINRLSELKALGMPVMIGTSRKSFIGKITGEEPHERREGTAATVTAAIMNGCHIIRVHDVAAMKKVAVVTDAIIHEGQVIK
jgi:dihydropteroate synthase